LSRNAEITFNLIIIDPARSRTMTCPAA